MNYQEMTRGVIEMMKVLMPEVVRRQRGLTEEEISLKGKNDFLTETDLYVDRELRRMLGEKFPETEFLTEETTEDWRLEGWGDFEDYREKKALWIIDPIDGTKSFAIGGAEYGVAVALAVEGRIVIGVIAKPVFGEIYYASEDGEGAWVMTRAGLGERAEDLAEVVGLGEGAGRGERARMDMGTEFGGGEELTKWTKKRLKVSEYKELDKTRMALEPGGRPRARKLNLPIVRKLIEVVAEPYNICSSACHACLVAKGEIDGMQSPGSPWDLAAGKIIVEKAGGVSGRADGGEFDYLKKGGVFCNSGRMMEEVVGVVKGD